MIVSIFASNPSRLRRPTAYLAVAGLLVILFVTLHLRADEPYARSRDYDLQHSRIALRFDLDQKKVIGDVTTHSQFFEILFRKLFLTPSV